MSGSLDLCCWLLVRTATTSGFLNSCSVFKFVNLILWDILPFTIKAIMDIDAEILAASLHSKAASLSTDDDACPTLALLLLHLEWVISKEVVIYRIAPIVSAFLQQSARNDLFNIHLGENNLKLALLVWQLREITGRDVFDDIVMTLEQERPSLAFGLSLSLQHTFGDSMCQNCRAGRIFRYFCHVCASIYSTSWIITPRCDNGLSSIKGDGSSGNEWKIDPRLVEEAALRGLVSH